VVDCILAVEQRETRDLDMYSWWWGLSAGASQESVVDEEVRTGLRQQANAPWKINNTVSEGKCEFIAYQIITRRISRKGGLLLELLGYLKALKNRVRPLYSLEAIDFFHSYSVSNAKYKTSNIAILSRVNEKINNRT
jgi:hypothetical protein